MSIFFVPKIKYLYLLLAAMIIGGFISAMPVEAADVLLSPSSGSHSANQTFVVNIQVDPDGDSINAVEAQLSFDAAVLSVVSISKTGSAFSLWTTEPTYSNTDGTITFGGGSPTPFSSLATLDSYL